MILCAFLGLLLVLLVNAYVSLVTKPEKLREILRRQGVDGPPPKFLLGNLLEIKKSREKSSVDHPHPPAIHNTASVFPFLEQWRKQYGSLYMFSLGKTQILYANSPDMVKEITTSTSPDLGIPSHRKEYLEPLVGQGIMASNGPAWERQRKILAPEFFMYKVEGMMNIITESARTLIDSWKHEIGEGETVDIAVDDYVKRFSGEVISRACFGSSYSEDQDIFLKLDSLRKLLSKKAFSSLGIPGLRYLLIDRNKQIQALQKEIVALILRVVEERRRAECGEDLLQSLLQAAKGSSNVNQFIVDNSRSIYLAAYETSAASATWCLMLLASNPKWQARVREEVEEVCQGRIPDIDMLRKMKLLHMVILEAIRLYPPAPILSREVFKDMKIGQLWVPKGFNLWVMVPSLHTDKGNWGGDALEFNPRRFENGVAGACKNPSMYMPFGFGKRVCIGQNLAMVELKVLMSLIVSTFSFTLSSNYVHAPVMQMVMEPKHGLQIKIKMR